MSEETKMSFAEKLEKLIAVMHPDYDAEADDWEFQEKDLFRDCIQDCPDETPNFVEVGGYSPEDTPYSLYRLLWLVAPKDAINFGDMYKKHILSFMSADGRFIVSAHFYKYELGLYFYAQKELVDLSQSESIRGGWPDADNGEKLKNPVDGLFFDVVKKLVEHEHCVYGGNDFFV
jgi:hypothetical protein